MALTPESITSSLSLGSFNIFGHIGQWAGNVLMAAIAAVIVYIIYTYFFSYTIPVRWYWVRGAEKDANKKGEEDTVEIKGNLISNLNPLKTVGATISEKYNINGISPGKVILDRGKLVTKNGVTYIKLLKGRSMFKYFPSYRYHDGMYCARIDSQTFMPLKRPSFGKDSLVLEPIDNDVKFWAAMKLQELRLRLEDDEYKKKALYIFFGAIIVVCIFVAVVIWMSYSYVNNHTVAQNMIADKLGVVADKIGLGGPG